MEYIFKKFSRKKLICRNNLFNSQTYICNLCSQINKLSKDSFWLKIKNLWNGFHRNEKKISSHLIDVLRSVRYLLERNKVVTVLDFGGGYGDNYYSLRRYIERKLNKINYCIVDDKEIIKLGNKFFSKSKNLRFFSELPNLNFDLVLMIGTIQYISNFKDLMNKIKINKNGYFIISRSLFSGLGNNYYSVQKLINDPKKSEILITIFSLKKFLDFLKKEKFQIINVEKKESLNSIFQQKLITEINYYNILCRKY